MKLRDVPMGDFGDILRWNFWNVIKEVLRKTRIRLRHVLRKILQLQLFDEKNWNMLRRMCNWTLAAMKVMPLQTLSNIFFSYVSAYALKNP